MKHQVAQVQTTLLGTKVKASPGLAHCWKLSSDTTGTIQAIWLDQDGNLAILVTGDQTGQSGQMWATQVMLAQRKGQ